MTDKPDIAEYEDLLNKAYIPLRFRRIKFGTCPGGDRMLQYMNRENGQYDNDVIDNRGLILTGDAAHRNITFPVTAKAFVLAHDNVSYIQLSDLCDALAYPEDNSRRIERWMECEALFIDDFYDEQVECRFSPLELRRVEAIIKTRIGNEQRVCVSSSLNPNFMTWYSPSCRAMLSQYNRIIDIPRV